MADVDAGNMRRQGISRGGIAEISGPDGTKQLATYTCCHCNTIHFVPENAVEMGFCTRCHARECLRCARRLNGRCVPFEKKLERYEQRQAFLRNLGGV